MEAFTWLTRISWFATAEDLSDNTLLQQRKEAIVLAHSMRDGGYDPKHPICRMWEGYTIALAAYGQAMQIEARRRGFILNDGMALDIGIHINKFQKLESFSLPEWKDDTDVIRSHRSNLMRRFPDEYGSAWKGTPEDMPYLWPFFRDDGDGYDLFVSKYDKELLVKGLRKLPDSIAERVVNL